MKSSLIHATYNLLIDLGNHKAYMHLAPWVVLCIFKDDHKVPSKASMKQQYKPLHLKKCSSINSWSATKWLMLLWYFQKLDFLFLYQSLFLMVEQIWERVSAQQITWMPRPNHGIQQKSVWHITTDPKTNLIVKA